VACDMPFHCGNQYVGFCSVTLCASDRALWLFANSRFGAELKYCGEAGILILFARLAKQEFPVKILLSAQSQKHGDYREEVDLWQ
jgi:hypothetical protein